MAKTKKTIKKAAARRSAPVRATRSSGISLNHSHPMYGYIALGVVVVVLYFIWGLL